MAPNIPARPNSTIRCNSPSKSTTGKNQAVPISIAVVGRDRANKVTTTQGFNTPAFGDNIHMAMVGAVVVFCAAPLAECARGR